MKELQTGSSQLQVTQFRYTKKNLYKKAKEVVLTPTLDPILRKRQPQLIRRLSNSSDPLLDIKRTMPRPPNNLDHPIQPRPTIKTNIRPLPHSTSEHRRPHHILDRDDEAFSSGEFNAGAESLADGHADCYGVFGGECGEAEGGFVLEDFGGDFGVGGH